MFTLRADINHGKSALIEIFTEYAQDLLPWALVDLKGTPTPGDVLAELNRELNKRLPGWREANSLGEALNRLEELARTQPLLLLFDTYEQGAEELRKTLERTCLGAVRRSEGLCFIVSGQTVPLDWTKAHCAKSVHAAELDALDKADD